MPIVRIDLLEGRPAAAKRELIRGVTAAVVSALGVQPAQVRVLLNEVPPEHWGIGGASVADREPLAAPSQEER